MALWAFSFGGIFSLMVFVVQIVVAIVLYRKAESNDLPNPALWALFGFAEPFIASIVQYFYIHR